MVAGDAAANVQLYDFEILQSLYHITFPGDSVTAMVFSSDNLRLLDIRGARANVWEPSALVREDVDHRFSERSDSAAVAVVEGSIALHEERFVINTMLPRRNGVTAICGRNNGVVGVQDLICWVPYVKMKIFHKRTKIHQKGPLLRKKHNLVG